MLFLLFCATVALSGVNALGDQTANLTCPGNWTQFQNHCFLLVEQMQNWAQAQNRCLKEGAHLASVHNLNAVRTIQTLLGGSRKPAWIGGSSCQEPNSWFWYDGTDFGYTYWCPAEPEHRPGDCCLTIGQTDNGFCWVNSQCDSLLLSVCAKAAQ